MRRAVPPWAALTVLVTVVLGLPALTWASNTLDEMILLVYPLRMLQGDLPYRDFFAAYGPAHWWALEGVIAAFGPSVLVLRLLGVLQHVAVTLATYRIARGRGATPPFAAAAGCLSALLLFRLGDAPYAWVTTTALVLWELVLLSRRSSRRRTVAAGLLAGLAVSVRPDALLLCLAPAVVLRRRPRDLRPWSAGLLVGLLPVLATALVTPRAFLDNIFLDRAGRGAGQSRLPFWPDAPSDRQLLLVLGASVLALVIAAAVRRGAGFSPLALLAVLALPQAFQRLDASHLVYAALVSLPFLPVALRALANRLSSTAPGAPVLAGTLGLTLALVGCGDIIQRLAFEARHGMREHVPVVEHDGRRLPEVPSRAAALRRLLPLLDRTARRGDELLVMDANLVRPALNDIGLYFLEPRLAQHAYNLEITPGVTSDRSSGLVEDVRRADVVVLVTASEDFRHRLFPYQRDGDHDAEQLFRAEFCKRSVVDYYEVWTRCAGGRT